MIINGRDFNFGRCLRIRFYKGDNLVLTVEHKPDVDPNYYVAMDVEVTDMPSPLEHDKPGFMGNITIYNPARKVLTAIASGATWFYDFANTGDVDAMSGKISPAAASIVSALQAAKQEDVMKRYYASRLRAVVEAGYVVKGVPNYTRILGGYVNGSSFSHRGQDDVLKIGVYDIDMTEISKDTMGVEDESLAINKGIFAGTVVETKWQDKAKARFASTWAETLKKYIKEYETEWINPNDQSINIVYVKSLRAWLAADSRTKLSEQVLDEKLKQEMEKQKMPNGGVSAHNLAGMLNGLCANADIRVDWLKASPADVSKNTYVIFRLGGTRTVVPGPRANIQIWNYQNLLETPSIDGAGKMTIRMVFNPRCDCNKTIALMLTSALGETDVTRNVKSFEGSVILEGHMVGSMSSTGNDAAVANNQITGNTNVHSQRKQAQDANQTGYLFNTGFPIIRVEHKLSTYGQSWDTTVKTVPITAGLKFEG